MTTVFDRIEPFRKALDDQRAAGRRIGLVPTMGALHAGHTTLIERAAADCDAVAVTVYVNPLQFGPTEDLAAYPRNLDADCRLARDFGAEYMLAPEVSEMFPSPPATTVRVAGLSEHLEGASRPGHFDGVATIVAKLLAIAGPCRAYFGEKDWQQLAVIRRLVQDLSLPVDVVGCPTVRQPDGLALSSRNAYLTPEERAVAPVLHRALVAGRQAIEAGERHAGAVRDAMTTVLAGQPAVAVEYAEVVDADDLTLLSTLSGEVRLLVAARLGRARLIDNLGAHA